jgi:hypothetical protein
MRPRPAIRAALLVDVSLALSLPNAVSRPLETAFARNARFPALFESSIDGPESTTDDLQRLLKLTAQSFPRKGLSEEAAPPRSPRHAATRLQETLQQFTLENRRKRQLYSNRKQRSRHLTFALAVLCSKNETAATGNPCPVVHKLWRTEFLCGKRRKNGKEPSLETPIKSESRLAQRGCGRPRLHQRLIDVLAFFDEAKLWRWKLVTRPRPENV